MKPALPGVLLLAALPRDEEEIRKAATFYASFEKAVKGDFGGGELEPSTRSNHKTEKGAFVIDKGASTKAFRIAEGKGIAGGALEATDVLPDNGRIFFPARGNIAYRKDGWSASLPVLPQNRHKTRRVGDSPPVARATRRGALQRHGERELP